MRATTLTRLIERRGALLPTVLATRLTDGAQWLLPDATAPAALTAAAAAVLADGRAKQVALADGIFFLHPHLPPPRLMIIGAVHIAQSLAPMAAGFGIEPTVIDPRQRFATEERFPGVALRLDWPDEAIASLRADPSTAIVVLSHDPKIDDPALLAALATEAFYVGALGSARSQAARLERLATLGMPAESRSRIRGPVGLALGAVTTEEIALSILAEIVAVRRSGHAARRS